ncbi:MAG: hypothetical protein JRE71_17395 [Deltaproteobacteria bacterium]|nr:hypothetical protein [Deltaproteobacteria bacterium]
MTISELGSIGEFVSAVAVVITLIYLSVQIRQNSATTRAHIRQSLADSQVIYIGTRATDPFVRQVVGKMFAGQEVDEQEAFGLRMHIVAGIRMYENYFAQQAIGTMVPEDWRAIREIIKFHFRFPAYRETFSLIESGWNREFASEVRKIIDELDRDAS